MKLATPLAELTEKEWSRQVVELAKTLGYRVYHTYDSRRSQPGFPDLVLVGRRIVYLELKAETGKLSVYQRAWLQALAKASAHVYLARPRHLQALSRLLSAGTILTVEAAEARGQLMLELDQALGKDRLL